MAVYHGRDVIITYAMLVMITADGTNHAFKGK